MTNIEFQIGDIVTLSNAHLQHNNWFGIIIDIEYDSINNLLSNDPKECWKNLLNYDKFFYEHYNNWFSILGKDFSSQTNELKYHVFQKSDLLKVL